MFARRRSSSLTYDKYPCLNVALFTCSLLVILGNARSMSLDRLGAARQYQQQNDKQLEFSDFMLHEAESEFLQNDLELVPAVDGQSDMYLLVPAANSQKPIEEQNSQSKAKQQQQVDAENSANVENNSDMLMLESDDAPAVQILELPADVLETEIAENAVAEQNENHAEELQVSDKQMDNLVEAVKEIKHEFETELLGKISEQESPAEEQQVISENAKEQETNGLPMEHIDNDLELSSNIANASVEKSSLEEDTDSEQEMIGVVMEEPEKINAADSVMDLEAEESEVQPTLIEMNNESQNQMNIQSENKAEETSAILEENKKMNEQPSEILDNNKNQSDEAVENLKPIEEAVTEIETNNNMEQQFQDDEVTEEIKTDDSQNVEQTQSGDTQDNKSESEVSAFNEIQADDESQMTVDDSAKVSIENQTVVKQQQQQETETEVPDQTANEKLSSAEEIQHSEEIQAINNEHQPGLKPEEESVESMQLVAESQVAAETGATEEIEKPVKEIEEVENMQPAEEIEKIKPVEETKQANDTEPAKDKMQNDEELSAVVENQEENTNLEQANPIKENQAEQTEEESQHDEIQLPLKEDLPVKAVEMVEDVQPIEDVEILKEDAKDEAQSVEDAQNIDTAQPMEEGKPIEEDQLMEQAQPMNEAQPLEDAQITEESQSMEEAQNMREEVKPMDDAKPMEEVHTMEKIQTQLIDEVKPMQEDEQIQEMQAIAEHQMEESTEANYLQEIKQEEELQTSDEIEDSKDDDFNQSVTEEAIPVETVTVTQTPIEEIQAIESQFEQVESEEVAFVPEEMTTVQSDELIAENSADELFNEKDDDNLNKESAFDSAENHEKPTEMPAVTFTDVETEDKQNPETQPIILADENILQNVDAVEEDQKDNQEETAASVIQKPLENKDSDNILNNYTNESENTSMLTAIVQVPTKEELMEQQQQQLVEIVETTMKPFNVLDSVLNYVNASFMNQINNQNNNQNNNDNIKQDENEEDEQTFSSKLRRYDGAQVWRIVVQNDKEKKLADELQTKYDGQLWKEVKQEVDYLLKPHVLADAERYVKTANLTRIVLIDNLQKVIEVENPPAEEIAQLQNRKGHRLTWQAYHRLEDIHGFFDYLAKTYPDICSVETIGYSIEKRPLKILKVSNGNANNPSIWIDGGMHAREWISPAVVTYVANQIVEGWDDLPAYMRNVNWYIHAVANPDGYEYSHTTDRLWRKNMRSHGRVCPGVDLNRNFGYKWGGKGTSANPCAQTYRGSKAFSEPETFYISKFISNFPRETFKAYLSFHSYGQYILYPWGYDYHVTKDMADLDLVARQAGTIITKSTGVKYTVGSSANTLYPAAGGSDDWAKGIAGIKYSYTIEMGDTGRYGFVLPADHIEPNGKNGFTFVDTVAKAITMGKNARRRKLKAHKTH